MAGKSTISITFKLDGDGKGFKELASDADGLKSVMTAAIVEANKLDKSLCNWSQAVQGIESVNKAIAQLNSTFQSVTADSAEFSKAMKSANTMAGKDAAGFAELKGQVSDLGKQIPLTRDLLANGLYQVISNGVPEDNWISFLEKSSRSAVGGIADVGEVVKVTSTIIKNYGKDWEEAGDIQDKIQLTAKNGVTSFEQLAAALPSVTGQAAQLGVSLTEMLAVMSTMTGVSGNTSEVATQLASVLTALTKESEKSQKAAEAMGISFNAASIRAAGGLQNFLNDLDRAVTQYAAQTGRLKESIYSELFGRAEALRLVNGLTGELSEKFAENIAALDNSAGTIDEAFETMASTGGAVTQMLKNQLGAITDVIAEYAGGVAPFLNFTSQLGMTAMSVLSLQKTFKALNIVQALTVTRTKAVSAVMLLCGVSSTKSAAATRVFSAALKGGAYSATAFKIALRGLMIATGIGAAIAAVTAIIELFVNMADEATESVEELSEAEEAFKEAATDAKLAIDTEVKRLSELMKANEDTAEAVQHLNETYGDIFGTHKTAAEWYDTLTSKSKTYVRQLGFEAQAKKLVADIASKQIELEMAQERKSELEKSGKAKTTVTNTHALPTGASFTTSWETNSEEYNTVLEQINTLDGAIGQLQAKLDVAQKKMQDCADELQTTAGATGQQNAQLKVSEMTWKQVSDAIEETEGKLKNTTDKAEISRLKAYNEQLKARKKILDQQLGIGTTSGSGKKTETADPKTYEELSTNIEIYRKKLTTADSAEQQSIREKIALWSAMIQQIELAKRAAERPAELNTLSAIDKELQYQRALRENATAETLAGIDSEIQRLEGLRKQMERNAHTVKPIETIQTYEELNAELQHYNDLLQIASQTERAEIQAQITALESLKKKWDDTLAAMKKPGEIGTLNTIEALDEAIAYYGAQQKKQSADEIANTQRVIQALEAKKKALQRSVQLPSMQKEADEINALSGKDYKIAVRGIGFDELTKRIKDLRKQLNDIDNPVTDTQRKDIEQLISTYESWRSSTVDAFGTVKDGWGAIKGIGGGIESITQAIESDGNAWQKITGIVDGFIQIAEGIQAIVAIIDMLSVATTTHATAKAAEAAAVTAEATAEGVNAGVSEVAAAAEIPVIAANKLATASYMELAAAEYMAAHAYIPFAGFGIAAGFTTAAVAMVEAIGAMPFANGGVIYGPTLGIMGEYSGASHNPEVVAPLDKLRDIIGGSGDGMGGKVEFEIKGRRLVGVYNKEKSITHRT